jgi:hypothetical protein
MDGTVKAWWWEKFHPYTEVLTIENFDLLTRRKDFYVRKLPYPAFGCDTANFSRCLRWLNSSFPNAKRVKLRLFH